MAKLYFRNLSRQCVVHFVLEPLVISRTELHSYIHDLFNF